MEYTETFELVLYFNRRAVVKPSEPIFESIQKENSTIDMDSALDIYSDLKNKYKIDMIKYERIRNDSVISDYVRIPEDDNFIETIKSFEKEGFFVSWQKGSKRLIDETFVNLLK
jgi:hypothetical protein